MRSIFEYLDYRKYLADYYAFRTRTNRTYSYRVFNTKAGISSPNYLKLVIDGKRNIGVSTIDKVVIGLGLNIKESLYFKKLMLFVQTASPEEKQEYYNVLRSMRSAVSEKSLRITQYDYFSNWYNAVIRELVSLYNFGDNFQMLAESVRPAMTPGEAKGSIELLLKLTLLEKKPDGTYEQINTAIVTDGDIGLIAVRYFNRSMHLNAFKAIDNIDIGKRNTSGLTMEISKSMRSIIDADIGSFKDN